jgi:Domain of unknown function (DUF4296)
MKLFIVFFCGLFFLSCNGDLPSGILAQEKMESILWEQMQADAFTREFVVRDTSKKIIEENLKIQQKIFSKYDIDKETFYKSYNYYLQHADVLKPIIDSIVSKQTRIKQEDFIKKMSSNTKQDWDWLKKYEIKKVNDSPYKLKGIIILNETLKIVPKPTAIMPVQDSIKPLYRGAKKGIKRIAS